MRHCTWLTLHQFKAVVAQAGAQRLIGEADHAQPDGAMVFPMCIHPILNNDPICLR